MGSSYINHFIQPDSLIPGPSNPQAWNRYSYVINSPIKFSDPTGHKICDGKNGDNCRTVKGSFGIHIEGKFTSEQKRAIRQAVEDVGYALWGHIGNSPFEAFRLTMGKVNFIFDENRHIDGWAITETPNITFDDSINKDKGNTMANIMRTVAHELGHVLDVRTGLHGSGNMWTTIYDVEGNYVTGVEPDTGEWYRTDAGYCGNSEPCQMHPANKNGGQSTIEEFADMFMNWTYNSFAINDAGASRLEFMTVNMADWTLPFIP